VTSPLRGGAPACLAAVVLAGAAGLGCDLLGGDEGAASAPPAAATELAGCSGREGEDSGAPADLACTGLYADAGSKTLSPRVRPFAPAVAFWSDGADKQRFIDLPDGATIDTTSMDEWRFPVGTKVWKEFRFGGRLVETRYFHKVRADRWLQAAYVWSADGASAKKTDGADLDVGGTPYHVPKTSECNDCHRGRKDKLLGFEAISLAQPGATGLTLAVLAAEQRLSAPPAQTSVTLADDATGVSSRAHAWLHVNCGTSCHTGTSLGTGYGTGLRLRLGWDEVTTKPPSEWELVRSTLDAPVRSPKWAGEARVVPGDPAASTLYRLLAQRGAEQMPPIATQVVDDGGRSAVEAWIRALTPSPAEPPPPTEEPAPEP